MNRPEIPRGLVREILVEAGHRCAIPTCRQTPVEIAHIISYEQVREHTFDNLIALCPTCHARYDRGEIDRKAMTQYKTNLSVLNGRYGDLEKRVLRVFAEKPEQTQIYILRGLGILLMNLLKDGLLRSEDGREEFLGDEFGQPAPYELTPKGREFIRKWLSAEELG
jgi:HNH endonuclease